MSVSDPTARWMPYLAIASGVVAAMHIGKMAPAIPVLQDALGISLVQAGFLLSAISFAGMTVGMLAGLFADSMGIKRCLVWGQALLAVAGLGGATSTDPHTLLVWRGLEGAGFLLSALPVPSLLRRMVAPQRLSIYLGWWGAYMPIGTASAMLVGAAVLAAFGWPWLWLGLASLSALMAILLWRYLPSDTPTAEPNAAFWRLWVSRLATTLKAPGVRRVALAFSCYSTQWITVIGFLPSVYAQAGIGGAQAGILTGLASLANMTGNVASGRLLHRGWRYETLLSVGFITMAVATWVAFQLGDQVPFGWRYAAVVCFSAVGGCIPGALFSLGVRLAPSDDLVATSMGFIQQCMAAGQFLGPPLVGWAVATGGSWEASWWVLAAAAAIGLWASVRGSRCLPAACAR
ncbi:MAG: CynX/NimT family MFS transporter [Burkholderiaceae bacterium]